MAPCLSVSVTSRSSNKTAQRVSYRIAPISKTLSDLEWPWVSLWLFETCLTPICRGNMTRINYDLCIGTYMNRRVSVAFDRNCFWKIKHYSRLQADAYTLVVSQKWCKMLLLHTTNRNYQKHVAYQFVPFQMTLNDLGDHSPVAGFFFQMQFDYYLCDILHSFNWHTASCGPSATV